MPYIKIVTTKKIAQETKDEIVARMGEEVGVIPGKSEGVLMVAFHDGTDMYFKGERGGNFAYVEVNLHGACPFAPREAFTKKVNEIMGKALDIAPADLYVVLPEYAAWGAQGKLFQ